MDMFGVGVILRCVGWIFRGVGGKLEELYGYLRYVLEGYLEVLEGY